jgi:hypothetical protein
MKIRIGVILLVAFISLAGLTTWIGWGAAAAQTPEATPTLPAGKGIAAGASEPIGANHPRLFRTEGSVPFAETATSDNFGYTRDDSATYNWLDASSGVPIDFGAGGHDDGSVGPINLGFNFRFYEYSYPQIYISTNGILTFGGEGTFARNENIPVDIIPNDLIAPFWDDLAVGSPFNTGQVYYELRGSAPNRSFVVQWNAVTRRVGMGGLLTFQAILFENGDIKFQYQTLDGETNEATVGIEDADGIDGLLYTYNSSSGLTAEKSILFKRPAAGWRVKLLPTYQGAFAVGGKSSFEIEVRNTGEAGSDTFDLISQSSSPGWRIRLYDENGLVRLTDSDGDGAPDTGSLSQGTSRKITIILEAPASADAGDHTQVTLTAKSWEDSNKQAQTILSSAVPAPFAQALADSETGIRANLIWSSRVTSSKVSEWFSGSTLALAQTSRGGYVYAWEKNYLKNYLGLPTTYTDIEYALLDKFGGVTKTSTKLTSNINEEQPTTDRFPVVAGAPDGKLGVVWVRSVLNGTADTQYNVYFAILNANGSLVFGPQNITQNNDLNVPLFLSPRITAVGDKNNARFVITWIDQRLQGGEGSQTNDIYLAIYSTAGNVLKSSASLTQSAAGGLKYFDPTVVEISGARVFLTFTVDDSSSSSSWIDFMVLDTQGNKVKSETNITGSNGWGPDAVQLESGKILVAWTNGSNNKISLAVLNDSSFSKLVGPTDLTNPNPRQSDFVSVTKDSDGRGIVTWMDVQVNHFLYYALVNDTGDLVTPPVFFMVGQNPDDPQILTSYAGQGNAPYAGSAQIFLPLVIR